MSLPLWLGFLATVLVVALSPGPGAALSMRVGLQHGYRHALTAILGLQAALLMQLALVAAGLGALLAASEPAFLALKLAGAGSNRLDSNTRAVTGQAEMADKI